MWISDPTPVINSTKQIDNWPICSPKSTCRLPTGIQVNRFWMMVRASPCRLSRSDSSAPPTPNDASAVAQPSRCPQASVRRPPTSAIAAPAADNATSSQIRCFSASALEQVGVVDRSRFTGAENRHDDGQSDHHLAGGDDHREERHHLAVEVAVQPGERDEGQVDRVEHQLDAHEHHNRVAPQQDTGSTDGEQQRREIHVILRIHDAPPLVMASKPLEPSATGRSRSSTGRNSRTAGTDNRDGEPSGSRAGVSTALCRAKTPGPGSGVGWPPGWNRSTDISRCVLRRSKRSRWARIIAPIAAVISRALVSSNAHRYCEKISAARPRTLPPALACVNPA